MIRSLAEFSRRAAPRLAGGCPGYGSGVPCASTNATRSVATTATQQQNHFYYKGYNKEEEEAFRDVSLFFLT